MVTKNNKLYETFAKAFHEVAIPALEAMEERLTNKIDKKADKADIVRLERGLEAIDTRLDRHDKRIQTLEVSAS